MTAGRRLADEWLDPDIYASGVDEGWPDIELYRLIVRGLQRNFHSGTNADRAALLSRRPHLTGTRWDAALAAVVEHTALTHGWTPPEWVNEPERFLEEPAQLLGWPRNDNDLVWLPGSFARRGVIIDALDLDERAGDSRQWCPRPGQGREPARGA